MIKKAEKKTPVTRVLEKVQSRHDTINQCNQSQEKSIHYSSMKKQNKGTDSAPHNEDKGKENQNISTY